MSLKLNFSKEDRLKYSKMKTSSILLTLVIYIVMISFICLFILLCNVQSVVGCLIQLFCFICVGWCQFSLSNGLHEAIHNNFGNKQIDFIAEIILAFPIGFSFGYRDIHIKHHRYLGDPKLDPDYSYYSKFPKTKLEFIGGVLYMLSGGAAIKQFFIDNSKKRSRKITKMFFLKKEIIGIVSMQIIILLMFSLISKWYFYFIIWLAPLLTFGKLFAGLRSMCEHGDPEHIYVTRTITGNKLQTGFLGMFNFNYHGEHHICPWVSYGDLGAFYDDYKDVFLYDKYYQLSDVRYRHFSGGYLKLLSIWFSNLPWTIKAVNGY